MTKKAKKGRPKGKPKVVVSARITEQERSFIAVCGSNPTEVFSYGLGVLMRLQTLQSARPLDL